MWNRCHILDKGDFQPGSLQRPQRGLPTAPDHLLHLHAELNIPDAAGTQLHILRVLPFRDQSGFHFPQRFDRAEIQVAAEDVGTRTVVPLDPDGIVTLPWRVV